MANDESSPIVRDVLINSTAMIFDNYDDSLCDIDYTLDFEMNPDDSLDIFSLTSSEEAMSIDQLLSNSCFDVPESISIPAPMHANVQQHMVPSSSPPIDSKRDLSLSLSLINPPETVYHVRYLSEIPNSPLEEMKSKKNVSGRYLKGARGRYVTIELPSILSDDSNLFIRVTRLTVPYQDISFIHPYPLLYSCPKKKMHSNVIIQGSSIYYKLNKQDICSHSKHFPNLILARLKQCQLKHINDLYPFDNNLISYPFIGNNVKEKIATYQLKKSQLNFCLVIRCEETNEFFDSNISCRSNILIEEEGTERKKIKGRK